MMKLDPGNVLLKPSQKRQLMAWLRRCLRIGNRLQNFVLEIRMRRSGKQIEVRAVVRDAAGEITCRARQPEWQAALRELVRRLAPRLHEQYLSTLAAT